ncbi:kelch repeat and BTB domain-containing protein 2-like [Drosophila innubila]|uniref:kelch repeat and BTB domain-containing protein 2-like n=1 Tax=Drosophila innubila TaxID=198719 RepID=UPI00148E0633|nr:kelch repeat and BTB domain-containing protein 2-like [Drosophila innubila]
MTTKQTEMLNKICIDKNFTDCTIIVDSIKFECHKIILSTGSEFFQRMFLGDFKESSSSEVHLQDVSPLIFKIFREYIYTYDSTVLETYDMQTLISLFKCGHMWLVPSIISDCAKILVKRAENMTPPDMTVFFELGHSYGNEILTWGIKQILYRDFKKMKHGIFEKSYYPITNNNNSALMLKYDVFVNLISRNNEHDRKCMTEKYLEFNQFRGDIPEYSIGKLEKTQDIKNSD